LGKAGGGNAEHGKKENKKQNRLGGKKGGFTSIRTVRQLWKGNWGPNKRIGNVVTRRKWQGFEESEKNTHKGTLTLDDLPQPTGRRERNIGGEPADYHREVTPSLAMKRKGEARGVGGDGLDPISLAPGRKNEGPKKGERALLGEEEVGRGKKPFAKNPDIGKSSHEEKTFERRVVRAREFGRQLF